MGHVRWLDQKDDFVERYVNEYKYDTLKSHLIPCEIATTGQTSMRDHQLTSFRQLSRKYRHLSHQQYEGLT